MGPARAGTRGAPLGIDQELAFANGTVKGTPPCIIVAWHGDPNVEGEYTSPVTKTTSLEAMVKVWIKLVEEEKSSAFEREMKDEITTKARIAGFMVGVWPQRREVSRGKWSREGARSGERGAQKTKAEMGKQKAESGDLKAES
jgi:hypothetical protein